MRSMYAKQNVGLSHDAVLDDGRLYALREAAPLTAISPPAGLRSVSAWHFTLPLMRCRYDRVSLSSNFATTTASSGKIDRAY